MNAAELLTDCLKKEGVGMIAGYSGRPMLSLLQAIDHAGIKNYQTRHEQGAGFMADGYARITNRPAVVLIQRGPGVTNCLTSITNAFIDGIPMVVLIGQGEMEMFGKGALQELDHLAFLPYFTKWAFRVPTIARIPEIMRRAFTIANTGRPGPVALELPMNLMESPVEGIVEPYHPVISKLRSAGDDEQIANMLSALLAAQEPVLYVGAGVLRSEASEELLNLAELLALPVMTSLPGKSAFPEDHELSLGMGGFPKASYGTKQAHKFVDNSDLVLALGTSFKEHGTRYFKPKPEKTRLMQVDISEEELRKNYAVDIAVLGDLKSVLKQLIGQATEILKQSEFKDKIEKRRSRIVPSIMKIRKEWMDEWKEHLNSNETPIDPYRITTELMKILNPEKSIILHDSGLCRAYICHHYISKVPGSFVGFGAFSSMGFSIPASIGAKVAAPEKEVVTIVGDGSFGMTGMEIETAVRYGIKTLTLVYNNHGLDAIKVLQKGRREKDVWDSVGGNYAEMAKGMGAYSAHVNHPDEIGPAIERALNQDKPAVLDLHLSSLVPLPNYP